MFAHATAVIVYTIAMFALAIWARRKAIHSAEDYIVAGRRLSFPLATATLLATWFGAGTLLHASNAVRKDGLREIGLEPLGPGICLIVAGLVFAKPLWNARVLTLYDFYAQRFGKRAEWIGSLYALSFFGWIATQLLGVAGILEVFFEIPLTSGLFLVAGIATLYTLIGGMWSVTITDAVQLVLLILGLFVLGAAIFSEVGDGDIGAGVAHVVAESDPDKLVFLPIEKLADFFRWLSLFLAGTLGIIPSQDLFQRVFASRSARTAVWSCLAAGALYILLGAFPILFGLAGDHVLDGDPDATVAALAKKYLSPPMATLFTICLLSTILSTIDSAILAPASVFAQNLLRHLTKVDVLVLTQICVVGVSAISLALAFAGESTSELLEGSYSMTLPSLVVLTFATFQKRPKELPAIVVLVYGLAVYALQMRFDWETVPILGVDVPLAIVSFATAILLYFVVDRLTPSRAR